jgi:hypothetical protein
MMEDTLKEKRMEAVAGLEDALEEIESGEGLSTFVEGHGLQSRRFRFEWREPGLEISYDLPTGRVLAPEEDQQADDAEAASAIRLALLVFRAIHDGRTAELEDGLVGVSCDEDGAHYVVYGPDGSLVDKGDGWSVLIPPLETLFRDVSKTLAIFWA